jgi:aspartyl aminopeptidase
MKNLINFLEEGITPYHVIKHTESILEKQGFEKLPFGKSWDLSYGKKYYVTPYASMTFAFTIGKSAKKIIGAMAHTDFPCFKIKPNPECHAKQFARVNVEPYGGMLLGTWFDRPLGIAGKVVTKEDVKFYDSKKALAIMPSLAPHLNKEANKKTDYDLQKECIPILAHLEKEMNEKFYLLNYISKDLKIEKEDILDYDLFFYNLDKPEIIGMDDSMINSPRIDNVASVSVLTDCIANVQNDDALSFVAFFDHEEIGSRSSKGADSVLLSNLLEKTVSSLGLSRSDYFDMQANGFLLSVDGAHSIHPSYTEKSDPTNEVIMGNGPTIKSSASQRYLTDSESTSLLIRICEEQKIPYQRQVNRSGMPGGSTLGPIATSFLPMKGVDLGIPMLAMHSSRELANVSDYENLAKVLHAFYVI